MSKDTYPHQSLIRQDTEEIVGRVVGEVVGDILGAALQLIAN
jgi:ADP-ribosylglycohydrolase